ncbi:MAG TPA: hypothetical protein VMG59_10725 [Phycisphaerae bacterium]|nr:hypothetical protein [Phycisphaerae bacterium]
MKFPTQFYSLLIVVVFAALLSGCQQNRESASSEEVEVGQPVYVAPPPIYRGPLIHAAVIQSPPPVMIVR